MEIIAEIVIEWTALIAAAVLAKITARWPWTRRPNAAKCHIASDRCSAGSRRKHSRRIRRSCAKASPSTDAPAIGAVPLCGRSARPRCANGHPSYRLTLRRRRPIGAMSNGTVLAILWILGINALTSRLREKRFPPGRRMVRQRAARGAAGVLKGLGGAAKYGAMPRHRRSQRDRSNAKTAGAGTESTAPAATRTSRAPTAKGRPGHRAGRVAGKGGCDTRWQAGRNPGRRRLRLKGAYRPASEPGGARAGTGHPVPPRPQRSEACARRSGRIRGRPSSRSAAARAHFCKRPGCIFKYSTPEPASAGAGDDQGDGDGRAGPMQRPGYGVQLRITEFGDRAERSFQSDARDGEVRDTGRGPPPTSRRDTAAGSSRRLRGGGKRGGGPGRMRIGSGQARRGRAQQPPRARLSRSVLYGGAEDNRDGATKGGLGGRESKMNAADTRGGARAACTRQASNAGRGERRGQKRGGVGSVDGT